MKFVYLFLALALASCSTPHQKKENTDSKKLESSSSSSASGLTPLTSPKELVSNKDRALNFLENSSTGNYKSAHSLLSPDGFEISHAHFGNDSASFLSTIREHLSELKSIKTYRAFQQGNKVVTQSMYDWKDNREVFDIFYFEKGRISKIVSFMSRTVGSEREIAGIQTVDGVKKTGLNIKVIKELGSNLSNAEVTNEMEEKFLSDLTFHGDKTPVKRTSLERLYGEGDFVAMLSGATTNGTDIALIDLFRLEEQKVVEQWQLLSDEVNHIQKCK